MTETFKEQLLRYLTSKLADEGGMNEPQFLAPTSTENNLYTYITSKTVQPVASSYKVIRGKTSSNEDLDYYLLVGLDEDDNSGFMVILDSDLMPINFINTYKSGTKFGYFDFIEVGDDGKLYGVETGYNTGTKRFVMLNNILANVDGDVILRKSYNLPENLQTGTIKTVLKKPGGSRYLFCSTTTDLYPLAVELVINVGESNEWNDFTYTDEYASVNGAWASWGTDDALTFKIVAIHSTGSVNDKVYVFKNGEGVLEVDKSFNLPDTTASWIQAIMLNEDTAFLSYCSSSGGVYNQHVYKIGNTFYEVYASSNTDVAMPGNLIKSTLYSDGVNGYISFNIPKANSTIEYFMGIIYGDFAYTVSFGALSYTTSQSLYVTNTFHQFNLYSYYLQLGDKYYISNSIFNNLKYNGIPYNNINGLVPQSAVLYGENNKPLFARNLYNKVVNGDTTISTIEVPSNVLNSVDIEEQALFSETNNKLVDNFETITTNIYETLDINFYNTIVMRNENDISNITINRPGASRLNDSASKIKDYSSACANKARINYSDNTHKIIDILDTQINFDATDKITYYGFGIYAPTNKDITSVEIISNDEKTSYATIQGNFVRGNLYNIGQNVRII